MVETFGNIIIITLSQIIGVLGIFFALGFLLSQIQNKTHALYMKAMGWKGILWTAWIGTPIHEFGHIFFCILFRHKITEIAIFRPNKETGGLGHVGHSYNNKSLYQLIGNFFIGAAPLISGGAIITLLLILLVPNADNILSPLESAASLSEILLGIFFSLSSLFAAENVRRWEFWLFLYVSFSIISHMAPSKADQKGMWAGFAWIVVLLFLINTILFWIGIDPTLLIIRNSNILTTATMIGIYALTLSIIHLVLVSLLIRPFFRA